MSVFYSTNLTMIQVPASFDGKTVGNSQFDLSNISDNTTWVPIVVILGTLNTASVTTPPHVSVGTNSPNYDDIIAAITMTGTANSKFELRLPALGTPYIGTAGVLFARVSVAAVALTYRIQAYVLVAQVDVPG